jgi:hypothetical protein
MTLLTKSHKLRNLALVQNLLTAATFFFNFTIQSVYYLLVTKKYVK